MSSALRRMGGTRLDWRALLCLAVATAGARDARGGQATPVEITIILLLVRVVLAIQAALDRSHVYARLPAEQFILAAFVHVAFGRRSNDSRYQGGACNQSHRRKGGFSCREPHLALFTSKLRTDTPPLIDSIFSAHRYRNERDERTPDVMRFMTRSIARGQADQ